MACMLEEQCLFQSLITSPFRRAFPIFKTNNVFEKVIIYPPIAIRGYIVRLCNVDVAKQAISNKKGIEGVVLGYAGKKAATLIESIPLLKKKSRLKTFEVLSSKSWYFADVYFENKTTWTIKNIKWQKEAICKE
ncbi:MAG: hypothetical protein ACTTKH_04485 [Treponema sp.]